MIKNTIHASAWTSLTPAPTQYRWLDEDIGCEVAVVGGGIAAAMVTMRFAEAGIDTVLLSDSPLGYGGTAVSSGMMTLSGEETLSDLSEKIGPERAMTAAHLLAESLDNVEKLCGSFENDCGFRRMDSLRYTAEETGSALLRREYSLRLHNGMQVEFLDADTASEQFTFPISAGVYTKNTAAQVDPYRMVHGLAGMAAQKGARIFENTGAETVEQTEEGEILVECSTGHTVSARYVVMATGLDVSHHCGGLDEVRTTYMALTEPVGEFAGWRGPCVIRREEDPRLYLSVTADNRILIGGLDSAYMDEKGRLAGLLDMTPAVEKRFDSLGFILRDMFPAIHNITVEYVFAAKDGTTKDHLPVIGRLPESSQIAYAMCCGDNGILYAEAASRLLLQQYQGIDDQELGLFSPHREWRIKR